MSYTKELKKRIKSGMTFTALLTEKTQLEGRAILEKNAMIRASLRERISIINQALCNH